MKVLDRIVGIALRVIASGCLVGLFALLFINVIARTFQLAGLAWFDEIVQGLFAWMVFTGAAALWRENDHFRVDWLETFLATTRWAAVLKIAVNVLSLIFIVAMTFYGWDLTMRSSALTPLLDLPTGLFYFAIPFSGALMCVYSIRDLALAIKEMATRNTGALDDI